jgi:hypothetical protein
MISLVVIQEKVNIAKVYYQTLLEKYRSDLASGDCCDTPIELNRVKWLIMALNIDLRDDYNTDKTQSLFNILNTILGAFNVAFTPNTQVQIPNTTYTVTGKSVLQPISIKYADFVGNTYSNTALFGFNYAVFNQNINRYMDYGTEYTFNPTGGIIIVAGVFNGDQFRIIDIVQT